MRCLTLFLLAILIPTLAEASVAFYYQKSDGLVIGSNTDPGDPQGEADSQGKDIGYVILPFDVPPVYLKSRVVINGDVAYRDDQAAITEKATYDAETAKEREAMKTKLNMTDQDLDDLKKVLTRR